MKVLNLQCAHEHLFEGWFASEDDFQSQLARGLVACPLCGDTAIAKRLSAPRLNLRTTEPQAVPQDTGSMVQPPPMEDAHAASALQAAWLAMARQVVAQTEDVGERFVTEARRIHYGDAPERGIRGQASREEAQALREEGVGVVSFPLPDALKGPLQ